LLKTEHCLKGTIQKLFLNIKRIICKVENDEIFKVNFLKKLDMALVMIEGCVICGNSSNQTITLKFIQLHPKVMNFEK